jgi:hypothetical protein
MSDLHRNGVAIVIPVYKTEMTDYERASLTQAIHILGSRDFFFICPNELDSSKYLSFLNNSSTNINFKFLQFQDAYFDSVKGYNKLMLSTSFYQSFTAYQYILIHQLDAWVFKDELDYWVNKKYDYIGAPWIDWFWCSYYAGHLTFPRRTLYKLGYRKFNLVGNGGFSLRKVSSSINNLKLFSRAADKFEQNEDFFFSFFINSYNPFFKVAPFKKALQFSFDELPEKLYEANNNQLPMACHAWPKYIDFWKEFINIKQVQ